MKIIVIALLGLLSSFHYSSGPEPAIRGVKVIWSLGGAVLEGPGDTLLTPVNVSDSLYIFYVEDRVVYKLPYYQLMGNRDGKISGETRYHYFTYLKDETYGLFFDSLQASTSKRLNVDSLLKLKGLNISSIGLKKYRLVETERLPDENLTIDKYCSLITNEINYADSALLYYTNALKNIDFSISDSLDRVKEQKLSKIRLVFNSQVYKGSPHKLPRREVFVAIEGISLSMATETDIRGFLARTEL